MTLNINSNSVSNQLSKNSMINAGDTSAFSKNKLSSDPSFAKIVLRDQQIRHDNKTQIITAINHTLTDVSLILTSNKEKIVGIHNAELARVKQGHQNEYKIQIEERNRILLFPSIMDLLLSQGSYSFTVNPIGKIPSSIFKLNDKINLATKTKFELKARTIELLTQLAEKVFFHIQNIAGEGPQFQSFKDSSFCRLFSTSQFISSVDLVQALYSVSANEDLCTCLLSCLDYKNQQDYKDCIYNNIDLYLKTGCKIDSLPLISELASSLASIDSGRSKRKQDTTNNTHSVERIKNILYALYVWSLITRISHSIMQDINKKINVNAVKTMKHNILKMNQDNAISSPIHKVQHALVPISSLMNKSKRSHTML
jgi:hypothetical protein